MKTTKLVVSALAAAVLAGCAGQPKALYIPYPQEPAKDAKDYEGLTKFTLAKSILYIDHPDAAKPATLVSTPAESTQEDTRSSYRYAIKPHDGMMKKTHLTFTKFDGTDLLKTLGITFEDDTAKTAEAIGGTIVAIGGVVWALPGGTPMATAVTYPMALDTGPLLKDRPLVEGREDGSGFSVPGKLSKLGADGKPLDGGIGFTITFGKIPDDAIPISEYVQHLGKAEQETFFFSACRTARINFTTGPQELADMQYSVRVADPNFIQTLKLPVDGSFSMHTTCGADVTGKPSSSPNTWEAVNKIMAQVKAVKDAWKTAKDNKAK
ncbi:putative Lipoprotein [Pseudomonas sp. IT-P100]|uniref:hypothetical protein n=1 Tax=Pseudomonas sp. IT-P100 TaxID=3026452 RepID=UPI0039DF5EC2